MIFKNKFIYLLLRCVFIAARGLSLVAASGGYSSLWCAGFSLRWLLSFRSTGSRRVGFSSCGSWALERRLSSCGAQAQLLRSMWDLRGPGLEPVSPALADGFLTTAPPAMSLHHFKYLHKSSAQFWMPGICLLATKYICKTLSHTYLWHCEVTGAAVTDTYQFSHQYLLNDSLTFPEKGQSSVSASLKTYPGDTRVLP